MSKLQLKFKQNEDSVSMFSIGSLNPGELGKETLMSLVLKYALEKRINFSMKPNFLEEDGTTTIRYVSNEKLLARITSTDGQAYILEIYGINPETFFN